MISLSCLTLDLQGKTTTISNNLASFVPHLFAKLAKESFKFEIRNYQNDSDIELPKCNTEKFSLDMHWRRVLKWKKNENWKYPLLSKVVKAFLSIFHGPVIESNFNFIDTVVIVS